MCHQEHSSTHWSPPPFSFPLFSFISNASSKSFLGLRLSRVSPLNHRPHTQSTCRSNIYSHLGIHKQKNSCWSLPRGRVSDTPESVETVISETPWRQFKKYNQTTKQQIFKLSAELLRFPQLLLAAHRTNTSMLYEKVFSWLKANVLPGAFFLNP